MNSIFTDFRFILLLLSVFGISVFSLFGIIAMGKKHNIFMDSSQSLKPQRFHTKTTPRAGGLGVLLGVCFGIVLLLGIEGDFLYFLLGGIIVFISGFAEDLGFKVSPTRRLAIQCIGVLIACFGMDAWIENLGLGFEFIYAFGLLFSVFAIVGVSNAINIIDGFNGLSGGVVLSVCVSIIIVAYQAQILDVAILALVIASGVLGFLILNFPYGRIFLGDGGAYFLGFSLAIILVILTQSQSSIVSPWYGFCVMVYPIWEVLFSIFRKKLAGFSAMKPDSKHLHMLLFKRLESNPLTSLIIVCANAPFIAIATLFYPNTFVLIITTLVFISIYCLIYFRLLR